mmetsp:Transcript_3874/g.6054  ORF Transcript_3874/g.6054 Transcript_3874/m.6054 type:complete len:599 (-) Transcript_3874:244-2040(-)|eukprot:CAMPEP_0185029524 /NCGR_PEP_ID=MMETSP1103-20130426/15876_1 /TAXON_ID=36769 /ORGANISM="Paraphysomonas bandaiensis, Strain Caron Lab Isolate" /LENGTH=598 /DNA_ID=CAMNT_0027564309 /DNA_START=25 /DNA_END=1821 /DNA_ORIENTATION=+
MPTLDEEEATARVGTEINRIYHSHLLPVEEVSRYHYFHEPEWTLDEITSKPHVMFLGQYSTGKTTFIEHLVGRSFPGQSIGPEPTTDKFTVLLDGPDDRIIPGQSLTVKSNLPYRGLEQFGSAFLERFEGAQFRSELLSKVTLIDTPGVLSGKKQKIDRHYDFAGVAGWFIERCDMIMLMFDTDKLDISDEFSSVIKKLSGHESKVRVILNKADQVDSQRLMKVYGALLWSLGQVMQVSEVVKVYVGNFRSGPLQNDYNASLFDLEKESLMKDFLDIPRGAAIRKINRFVKRARKVKVHALLLDYMKGEMPMIMGKAKKQNEMADDLETIYETLQIRENVARADFPEMTSFREHLKEVELNKLPKLKKSLMEILEGVFSVEVPRLMESIPGSESINQTDPVVLLRQMLISGLPILKHARSGKPQVRWLYCDPSVTTLYWSKKPMADLGALVKDKSRTVPLGAVKEIRKGTELDPDHIPKLGTAVLRRKAKPSDLPLCLSLVLPKRTVDLQCCDKAEAMILFGNLSQHLMDLRSSNRDNDGYDDRLSECFTTTSSSHVESDESSSASGVPCIREQSSMVLEQDDSYDQEENSQPEPMTA